VSIKLLSAAWDLDIGSTEKMVLMSLCDFANEQGTCWPSVATICRKTSKSERTVQTALKWLKDNGYFEINGYHKQTPLYELDAAKILAAQPLEYSHYVYRIDDHTSGYFYIGARSCSCAIEDDEYMGSGNWVKAARRDGHALSKSIIQVLGSREELAQAEVAHVTPVFGTADCKNEKIPTPGTLSTPAEIAPRNFRTPQKMYATPAKSAPKPLRTTIIKKIDAHELPENWEPSAFGLETQSATVMREWSQGHYTQQLEHFTAHHRARGSKFKNWQDAWSTWVLNSRKFGNGNTRRTGSNSSGNGRANGFASALRQVADGPLDEPINNDTWRVR